MNTYDEATAELFYTSQKQKKEQCQIGCYVEKFNLCSKINLWPTQTGNWTPKSRSSRSQMFFKIGVLKNLINLTGKYLCWILSLIKLQAFRPANLLKSDSNAGVSRKMCQIFKNIFFTERLQWLLLTKGLNWYILYITL